MTQQYFRGKRLFFFLAMISVFAPISTDIYLPSMPNMLKYFAVPQELINLTLSGFFIFYSIGMLLWGPLSDKFGRKPILFIGLGIYTLASLCCTLAGSIWQLIMLRCLQGLGGSASVVVAGAIIKDSYEHKERETAIAVVQSIAVLAPMVAPMLGALLVTLSDRWQLVFFVLTMAGGLITWATYFFSETHRCEPGYTLRSSLLDLKVALQNYSLTALLIIFSLPLVPFLSYIVLSSYIYMQIFGLDAPTFSVFFALNASCSIIAPILYIKVLRGLIQTKNLVALCFSIIIVSGLCMYRWGSIDQTTFLLSLLPASLAGSILRPPGANLMLSRHKNAGTTSALMGFSAMLLGGIGTLLASLGWTNLIEFLGGLFAIVGLAALTAWLFVYERILE